MRVIFMGTPDFAVASLEEIIKAGHEVVLVVTQPDKPKGRGKSLAFPPVKECAVTHGIEVFQPKRIRDDANVEYLKKYKPDIIIVAAMIKASNFFILNFSFIEFFSGFPGDSLWDTF